MAGLEVVSFSGEHLEAAGRLLARRHARQRVAEPRLPERFEESSAAADELAAVWAAEGASGAAAFRGDRLVGYLVAAPREADLWGENVWVEAAAHAVERPEDVRDLYAVAAARWVEEGWKRHYVLVPGNDGDLVDAWFRLGFGQQQAHGIREVPVSTEVRVPDRFEIREPREAEMEIERLLNLGVALPAHQRASPVFSERPVPSLDAIRSEWRRTLAGSDERVLIGLLDHLPVACWATCDVQRSSDFRGLMRPDCASFLLFAVTLPEARGSGIGVALTDAALQAAAADGYRTMVTDWRVTNLLASRFWPKRGFRTAFLRLYRSIP
jgi:ribosomal protein S18 acetylase RimI-like enzyme